MIDNKTLQRYEFKYFLSNNIAEEIKSHASKFMVLDKFADINKKNTYLLICRVMGTQSWSIFAQQVLLIKIFETSNFYTLYPHNFGRAARLDE